MITSLRHIEGMVVKSIESEGQDGTVQRITLTVEDGTRVVLTSVIANRSGASHHHIAHAIFPPNVAE
jgi:hypothetical protein